jgi:hypothetical protein
MAKATPAAAAPVRDEAPKRAKGTSARPAPVVPAPPQGEVLAEGKKRTRVARAKSYPSATLAAAAAVAEGIRDSSRAREAGLVTLATALGRSPGSSSFRALVTASADYGLTKGNYKSEIISLTDRGLAYVRPRDDSERGDALTQAALQPTVFAKLYSALAPGKWPPAANVENVLVRDLNVPPEFAKEAASIARENAQFVGLLQDAKGGAWITLNPELRRQADDTTTSVLTRPTTVASRRTSGWRSPR